MMDVKTPSMQHMLMLVRNVGSTEPVIFLLFSRLSLYVALSILDYILFIAKALFSLNYKVFSVFNNWIVWDI